MISAWTKHLSGEGDKQKFQDSLYGVKHIFTRMKELLKEEENNLDKLEISPKVFEQPNWAYRQAYYNGFRACLAMIHKLINLDHKDNK